MTDDHQELFSGGKPFTLGAAEGLQCWPRSALPSQRFPRSFPLPFQRSSSAGQGWAGHRPGRCPPASPCAPQPGLPSPGAARSLPAVPALPREQGHAGTASPCPGHARKLCLTLHSAAQPLGTKNRPCARLDVFLSAGCTPSSRSICSIGGTR